MLIRRERRDAAEHRQLILQTATRLFTEQGVEQVSMHQIAKCAGVGQGTLYRRYGSKGDLCMDLIAHSFQTFKDSIKAYLLNSTDARTSDRMLGVMQRCIDFMDDKGPLFSTLKLMAGEVKGDSMFDSAPYTFMHGVFAHLYKEYRERRGLVPDAESADFNAHAVMGTLCPALYFEFRVRQGKSKEQILLFAKKLYIEPHMQD
jgi:AcrR family transcriptional regulator